VWPGIFRPTLARRGGQARDTNQVEVIPLVVVPTSNRAGEASFMDAAGWVDASRAAVQQNGLQIRVNRVEVATLPFKTPPKGNVPAALREKYLLIHLETLDLGAPQNVVYQTWGGITKDQFKPILTDSAGKSYTLQTFDRELGIVGRILTATTLFPGQTLDELLVFDKPAGAVTLHLELPAAACGREGRYRLSIPASMIKQ
jgi:hypothetical protein